MDGSTNMTRRLGAPLAAACLALAGLCPPAVLAAPTSRAAVSPAEALGRAEDALNARDAAAASGWLEPVLTGARVPPDVLTEAQALAARAWLMRGDNDRAMALIDAAVDGARARQDGATLLGLLRERVLLALRAGRTDVAARDLADWEAMAEEAGEPQLLLEARIAAARFLLDRGNSDLALERLSKLAIDARRTDLRAAYVAVGEVWLAKRNPARALAAFDMALTGDAEASDALLGRARARLQLQQVPGAREDLAAARGLLPRMPSGLARDAVGEGIAELEASLAGGVAGDSPVDAVRAQRLQGNAAGALAAADAALQRQPQDPPMWIEKARAHAALAQWPDAVKSAQRAVLLARNDAAPREALAEVQLLQGEFAGAATAYSSVSALRPDSRYPRAGGTLAQALRGVEVYDPEGFADDLRSLLPAERAALKAGLAAARTRGALPPTAVALAAALDSLTDNAQ
jgi:hypothetical protein